MQILKSGRAALLIILLCGAFAACSENTENKNPKEVTEKSNELRSHFRYDNVSRAEN